VATLALPTHDQQIRLDAVAIDGRLVAKGLATTRASGIAAALAAQPIEDVPQIVSQLFPLCGTAHAIASLTAIEAALGLDVSPAQLVFRELMLLAEHGAALGWRILMDWPPLLGNSPDVRACADIRRAAAAAVSAAAERGRWPRIGGARLRPDRNELGRAMSELVRMLVALFPEAANSMLSWNELEPAMQGGASTPARLINIARADGMAGYGHHDRPLLPPMDADWFAARLAAQRLEGPAQLAGAEYGYNAELCSYARTHLGCSVLTLKSTEGERSVVVGMNDSKELAARLPSPDFFVNNYAGCSTGQQWDGISYRVFGKELPIFNISHPFLWGNKPDAGYLRGEEWEAASRYVADQLRDLISFLEAQTGRPFDYDALSEAMTYIKRAAELRREGLDLCKAKPAPATPPAAGTRSCSPTCG